MVWSTPESLTLSQNYDVSKERPRLRWVDPYKCRHPKFVALWRFRDRNDIIYRCMVWGTVLTVVPSGHYPRRKPEADEEVHL